MRARTVLCYGDSNTYGTVAMADLEDQGRFSAAERWPGVMARALGDAWTVIAEGHPGRTTVHDDPIEGAHRNGFTVLPAILESHRPLDAVIVMLGTNDLKARFSVTPLDIARSVGRLIETIAALAPGARILVVSPSPIEEAGCLAGIFTGGAEKSRALAPFLVDIAARRGVEFFDAATVARVDPLDGVHLDVESHARLGAALADLIARGPDDAQRN